MGYVCIYIYIYISCGSTIVPRETVQLKTRWGTQADV
jgi:hypothetical protein